MDFTWIYPLKQFHRQLADFIWSKCSTHCIIGTAVYTVFTVINTLIGKKDLQQGNTASVCCETVTDTCLRRISQMTFLSTALYTTGCTCHVIFCRICQYFQFFLYCKIFLYDQLLITIRTFVCFLILSHGSEKCNGKIEHLFLLLGKNIAAQKSFPVLPYKVLRSMND